MTIKDMVRVPPTKFGVDMDEAIRESLMEQVEGRIDPDVGVLLAITDIKGVSGGEILPEDGAIFYEATFDVLSYAPEVNEMVLGEVVDVTAFGAFVRIGPIDALTHISQVMDDKVSYNDKQSVLIGRKNNQKIKIGDIVRGRVASVSLGKA